MNDSRVFMDAESVRSGLSHVPSQPALFPPYRDPGGLLSRSVGMPIRKYGPPSIWDTQGISGNVFANPYPGGFNPWIPNVTEDTSPHVTSERQIPDTALNPRSQSVPSAGNSFDPEEGRFSKNYGADQQRLQISELHFDKFHTPTTFACWKIRVKIEVCTCSRFPPEAMVWIKEVEMVESVDDIKSSRSIRGTHGPDFELLDARIASALCRIIHNSHFKRRVILEEQKSPKRGPLPSRKTDRLLDLRILLGHWGQWFCRELCGSIYSRSSKWQYSGIRFKVGRNSIVDDTNPISWHLGRIVQN